MELELVVDQWRGQRRVGISEAGVGAALLVPRCSFGCRCSSPLCVNWPSLPLPAPSRQGRAAVAAVAMDPAAAKAWGAVVKHVMAAGQDAEAGAAALQEVVAAR